MQLGNYIRQQPSTLADLPAKVADDLIRLDSLALPPERIVLLGTGSSMNALLAGAEALEEATGATVLAKEPEAFLRLPPRAVAGRTLVLAASQSGMSTASVEAVRLAHARGFPTLVITCDGKSKITETGADVLVMPIGEETIGPKTKGYTATVLSIFAVAARLGRRPLELSHLRAALEETVDTGLAVAKALAAELKSGGFDLVLFGKHAFDTSSGVVGTATAELLGLPCVTAVSKLDIANGRGSATRDLEGAAELVEFALPAVVTIDEGIARPRYPSLKGIMAAKKKPLESKPAQLGTVRVTVQKAKLPPERPAGRIIGEGAAAVPELVRLLQTEAKVL